MRNTYLDQVIIGRYSFYMEILMKKATNRVLDIYFGIPSLAKKLLPAVILGHLVIALCLNIPAYFKRGTLHNYDIIGQFMSSYYWGCLVGAILGGCLTLYFKSTKISGWGLVILSGALLTLFSVENYWKILLSMLVLGFFGTIVVISNITSLLKTVSSNEPQRLKIICIDLILFNLCFSFATYILLALPIDHLIKFIYMTASLLLLSGMHLIVKFNENDFEPVNENKIKQTMSLPEKTIQFALLLVMIICFGLIFSMVKVIFTPTILERFGSNMVSVTMASINPWVFFIFQPLVVDRIRSSNSTWFLGFGVFVVGSSYFMFGNVNSFLLSALSLVLLTFGEMMFSPLSKHMIINLFGTGREGFGASIWKVAFWGSGVLGSAISGYFSHYYGSQIIWEISGLLGIFCLILSYILRNVVNKTSRFDMIPTL